MKLLLVKILNETITSLSIARESHHFSLIFFIERREELLQWVLGDDLWHSCIIIVILNVVRFVSG